MFCLRSLGQAGILPPIISAPIGEFTSVELVIAVRRAGGMGSFTFGFASGETIVKDIEATRNLCPDGGPINANLFAMSREIPTLNRGQEEDALAFLKKIAP